MTADEWSMIPLGHCEFEGTASAIIQPSPRTSAAVPFILLWQKV